MIATSTSFTVDRIAVGVDDAAEPRLGRKDRALVALEHGAAAEPYAGDRPERQAECMAVAEADDLRGELVARCGLDRDASADAEFAHRSDDFDEEPLHCLHAAENLDLVDGFDRRNQRLHMTSCAPESRVIQGNLALSKKR
jgi:hypothetical protein